MELSEQGSFFQGNQNEYKKSYAMIKTEHEQKQILLWGV